MTTIENKPAGTTASADAIPLRLRRSGGSPRQVFAITVIGTLVLAVFASRDLASWTDRFGDGRFAPTVQSLAAQWDGTMAEFGLVRPHEELRLAIRRLLDWEWPGRGD